MNKSTRPAATPGGATPHAFPEAQRRIRAGVVVGLFLGLRADRDRRGTGDRKR
jgi:hypothetical protein